METTQVQKRLLFLQLMQDLKPETSGQNSAMQRSMAFQLPYLV
jgi:hypothetical protein